VDKNRRDLLKAGSLTAVAGIAGVAALTSSKQAQAALFGAEKGPLPREAGAGVRVFYDVGRRDVPAMGQIFVYDYSKYQPKNLVLQTPGGKVGIGTVNPREKLDVAGKVRARRFIQTSSREFKENIAELSTQEAVEALEKLNPVKFSYKVDDDKTQYPGFIAEEVPELVATPDRQGVDSMDIVAVLTKVVQQQQQSISALQEEFKSLKERIG